MVHYSDLSLKTKITLVMESMMTLLCIILCFSTILFFSKSYEKEADRLASQWTNVIAANINQTWKDIYNKILFATTDDTFSNLVINQKLSFMDKKVAFQPKINAIMSSSYIVDNAYFLTDKGEVLSSFDDYIINPSAFLSLDDLENVKGITMLKEMRSPFRRTSTAIPVVIPFSALNGSNYIGITQDGQAQIYLIVLLSTERIKQSLKETTSDEMDIMIQFYFRDYPLFVDLNKYDTSYITVRGSCDIKELQLDIHIKKSSLFTGKSMVITFSIATTLVIVFISAFLISLISKRLMAPFTTITRMLERMKYNTYKFDVKPKYRDESGALITSINDMYGKLMENLEKVKYEEKEKFLYMSQMLTEQINPHFIYNTLEIINMEIINGNMATASEMVSSFSSFLRYSLNQGSFMIKLSDEIKQAENYMKIMNFRLNGIISFSISCSPELYTIEIPKLILQPLVENAIKHGFNSLTHDCFIDPQISVHISLRENILTIVVSDNGQGIDIEKAERVMNKESEKKSFGLNNIATRLQLFDSSCKIEFTSIPFFSNEVIIKLHVPS